MTSHNKHYGSPRVVSGTNTSGTILYGVVIIYLNIYLFCISFSFKYSAINRCFTDHICEHLCLGYENGVFLCGCKAGFKLTNNSKCVGEYGFILPS